MTDPAAKAAMHEAGSAVLVPANDNVPGTTTPDDRPFLLALAVACILVFALAAYVAFITPNDGVALRR